jgi:hypothetical protein
MWGSLEKDVTGSDAATYAKVGIYLIGQRILPGKFRRPVIF